MKFIFSTPVLIRQLWQLKRVVFLHRCLICAALFQILSFQNMTTHTFKCQVERVIKCSIFQQSNLHTFLAQKIKNTSTDIFCFEVVVRVEK
jgi:hypothetical protein